MIAGIAAFAWVYYSAPGMRGITWIALAVLSVIAIPTAWSQMKTYPHQNLEQAWTRAISTGEDQEGTASRGGYQVGISPEREIANFIEDQSIPKNEILTDNSRTYGVITLTGHPDLFFDRVDHGDQQWQQVLNDPQGKVDFMLVENNTADLILKQYPGAIDGKEPTLEPVVQNDRYTLLRVVSPSQVGTGQNGSRLGHVRAQHGPEPERQHRLSTAGQPAAAARQLELTPRRLRGHPRIAAAAAIVGPVSSCSGSADALAGGAASGGCRNARGGSRRALR